MTAGDADAMASRVGEAMHEQHAADLAALESRAAELEAALRALVSVQAACMVGACGDPSCTGCDVPCTAPATRFSGCMLACDAHGEDFDDTGNAAALRAALLLLAKGGTT